MGRIRYCEVPGCGRRRFGNGYCSKHYARVASGKDPLARTKNDPNEIITKGDISEIILRSRKMEEIGRAIVDTEDLPLLSGYIWSLHVESGYAYSHSKGPSVRMHQIIMGVPNGMLPDHKNGLRLDNRKSNLRIVTDSQNAQNMGVWKKEKHSKYKGVCLLTSKEHQGMKRRWMAYIRINGKQIFLGNYLTQEDAAIAYDTAAKEHFGEYARLNFPNME